MNQTRHLEKLRSQYRSKWDAYHIIANRNATLLRIGRQPSNEQLIDEQRAATALRVVRDELRAAISAQSVADGG